MDTNKEIKKIDKELKAFYNEADYGEIARRRIKKKIKKVLTNESDSPITIYNIFKDLNRWTLHDTFQTIYTTQEKPEVKKYFTQSTAYGYLHVKSADTLWGCIPKGERFAIRVKAEYEFMHIPARYMAQALICGWEKEAVYLAKSMIESINFGKQEEEGYTIHKLIADGFRFDRAAWFALELYCKAYNDNECFDREKADYPQNMYPYDKALEKWDSEDLEEIDKLIYMLCEIHVEQSQEQKTDEDYFEFGDTYAKLFPYEILTWLKFREKTGLKNPTKFTHPLMNTPIAKFFLSLETPLPYPDDLPYVKELLKKLKEQCPNVEVPEWLK